jgi:hypothetical protein
MLHLVGLLTFGRFETGFLAAIARGEGEQE